MTYKALFTSILFTAFSTQIQAVNNTEQHCLAVHNQVVADYLNISVEQLSSRTLGAACKVDPANNTETLLSYAVLEPKFTKDNYQADQNNTPNWEHLVMRIKDGVVLQSWKTEEVIDASMDVNENSFKIDTAPYILNKDVRAFGVRFKNAARGPSAPEYSSDDVLTLFVSGKENKKLNIVFSYPMHIWYLLDAEENKTEIVDLVLVIDPKKQSKGFNDIILKANITQLKWSKGVYDIGTVVESETKRQQQLRLKYDGKSYKTTQWFIEQ